MSDNHAVFECFYEVLYPHIKEDGVTDLFINNENSIYVDSINGLSKIEDKAIDTKWINNFTKVIASSSSKSNRLPIISATLLHGERIEVLQPPAVQHACMSIRKPTSNIFTIDDLDKQGIFDDGKLNPDKIDKTDEVFKEFLKSGKTNADILKKAVLSKLNIVIAGATGSAKTTLSKALIEYIPKHERIITLEDAEELKTPNHNNSVHMFYPREKTDDELITANTLLLSCLRFKPDRIMLAEVRGEEAFEFLDSVNTGHPGSITTIHATSAHSAVDRFVNMVRRSPVGNGLSRNEVRETVIEQVDLILYMENRRLKTLYFPRFEAIRNA